MALDSEPRLQLVGDLLRPGLESERVTFIAIGLDQTVIIDWTIDQGTTNIHFNNNTLFNDTDQGVVTGSGGGTTNFLRADHTWAAPPSGGIADGTVEGATVRWDEDVDSEWEEVTDVLIMPEATGATVNRLELQGNQTTTTSTGAVNVDVGGSGANILRMHDGHPTTERGYLLTAEYTLSAANRTVEISSYGASSASNQPLMEWEFDGWVHMHNRQVRFSTGGSMFLIGQTGAASNIASMGQVWIHSTSGELFYTDPSGGTSVLSRGPGSAELVTTTNVITADETGKTFYLDAAGGFTSTLPAPALGLKFTFIVKTAPTTAYIVTTNAGANILYGTFLDIIGELTYFSAQDQVDFVASTSVIGDRLEVESDGVNWHCTAISGADGGVAVTVT